MIVGAVFFYNTVTPFPGLAALAPCIGTGIVIFSGKNSDTIATKFLSLPPLVYIGQISYSLYLVHWPLIVFSLYYLDRSLGIEEGMGIFALTFVLASLSYRYIENPARGKNMQPPRPGGLALKGTAIFIACGILSHPHALGKGYDARLSKEAVAYSDGRYDWTVDQESCADGVAGKIAEGKLCRFNHTDAKQPSVILWGDSHATALIPAIQEIARKNKFELIVATTNGCPPVLNLETDKETCIASNNAVKQLIDASGFDVAILAANWNSYGHDNPVILKNDQSFADALKDTIESIHKKSVHSVLIGQVPRYTVDIPTFLAKQIYFKRQKSTETPTLTPLPDEEIVEGTSSLGNSKESIIVQPASILCPADNCLLSKDGRSLYKDASHLSAYGSLILMPHLEKALKTTLDYKEGLD